MPHAGLFAEFLVELEGILFLQIPRSADAEEREIFDHGGADVGDLGEFLGFFRGESFFHNGFNFMRTGVLEEPRFLLFALLTIPGLPMFFSKESLPKRNR